MAWATASKLPSITADWLSSPEMLMESVLKRARPEHLSPAKSRTPMKRAIVSAALVIVLIAATLLSAGGLMTRPVTGSWGCASATKAATESWPICTAMTALGTEADWGQLDPDFAAGKRALAAEDWSGAIASLTLAALRDPRNADIQNYIGYAYRRLDDFGPAMGHYQQALIFNPRQRSAREHLGQLYLCSASRPRRKNNSRL